MNLLSFFISISQFIILVIIFYITYLYLYPLYYSPNHTEKFTNSIQHSSYVCKTDQNIFDLFYLDLHHNLYFNPQIHATLKNNIHKILRNPKPIPKKFNIKQNNSLKPIFSKPNSVLSIWPNDIILTPNKNVDIFIACQNDFMKSYFSKSTDISQNNINTFYLLASLTFTKQSFTHIICPDLTFYKFTFKEQLKLLENLAFWTKNHGFIVLTLFQDSLFETCNQKNIFLSSKHSSNELDSGKIKFDHYSVSTKLTCSNKDATYKNIIVKEYVKFNHKSKKRIYEYCLNITPLSKIIKKLETLNFYIKDKLPLSKINSIYDKQFIYIFKKTL